MDRGKKFVSAIVRKPKRLFRAPGANVCGVLARQTNASKNLANYMVGW
jgi:hypothetical protein